VCGERSRNQAFRSKFLPHAWLGSIARNRPISKCAEIDRLAIAGSDSWAWNVRAGTRATRGASFTSSVAICTLRGSTDAMSE
jgi:hypothetical protein